MDILYITGRSKEVINRGGETIAPMEVEEAVVSHPDVMACAAFLPRMMCFKRLSVLY